MQEVKPRRVQSSNPRHYDTRLRNALRQEDHEAHHDRLIGRARSIGDGLETFLKACFWVFYVCVVWPLNLLLFLVANIWPITVTAVAGFIIWFLWLVLVRLQ